MQGNEILIRYIVDAEAAERNFEDALATFGHTGEQSEVKHFFEYASAKAKTQHERLAARLKTLGGSPSTAKSFLAHILAFAPTVAQLGHTGEEKNTQHLMICIAAAAAEMAMYESLATVANASGDSETEQLARKLQSEEKEDYDMSWGLLRQSALDAFGKAAQRQASA